jgi:hypothetical protein
MKFKTSRADMKSILCAFSTNSLYSFTKTFAYSIENENNAMSLFEICTGMIAKNKDCLLNLLFISFITTIYTKGPSEYYISCN